MNETLDKIITDERLAWDKTLSDKREQFVVHLDSEIIHSTIFLHTSQSRFPP